ncbi:MAG: hypothetical protein Q9M13_08080 [Mariprofundales bacterium]|nr:hypothetical protein [Mariprofundales bacterium]
MIPDLLPILDGWNLYTNYGSAEVLAPGAKKTLLSLDRPGWILLIKLSVDNPDVMLSLRWRTMYGRMVEYSFTPRLVYEDGLLNPNNLIWCSRYDDTSKVYVLYSIGSIPFYGQLEIAVENKLQTPITILGWGYAVAVVEDIGRFRESLRSIFASGKARPWWRA